MLTSLTNGIAALTAAKDYEVTMKVYVTICSTKCKTAQTIYTYKYACVCIYKHPM